MSEETVAAGGHRMAGVPPRPARMLVGRIGRRGHARARGPPRHGVRMPVLTLAVSPRGKGRLGPDTDPLPLVLAAMLAAATRSRWPPCPQCGQENTRPAGLGTRREHLGQVEEVPRSSTSMTVIPAVSAFPARARPAPTRRARSVRSPITLGLIERKYELAPAYLDSPGPARRDGRWGAPEVW